MLTVKIEDIDKIGEITAELEMLTYLQGLIINDISEELYIDLFSSARKDAEDFLWQKQSELLLNLKEVIVKEDFIQSIK